MKERKLTLSIAALSLVASLNASSSGSSAAQHAAASTGIWMKRASADSQRAADTRPNGKIAFLRNRGGAVDVFVVNPSGMTPINLTRSRANELYVDWSPNGRHVVFTRFGKGAGNLFRISRSGTGLQRLTSGPASDEAPRWSPDGSAIAFDRTDEDGQADVGDDHPQERVHDQRAPGNVGIGSRVVEPGLGVAGPVSKAGVA